MNATLQRGNGILSPDEQGESREPTRLNDRNPSESEVSLQRALRTLSSIRQRYELARHVHPDAPFLRVDVVVEGSDVAWLSATIEALEKAIAAGVTEALRAAQGPATSSSKRWRGSPEGR
jgi:hypothetical protein